MFQIIEDPGDLEGWSEVASDDKKAVLALIEQHQEVRMLFFHYRGLVVKPSICGLFVDGLISFILNIWFVCLFVVICLFCMSCVELAGISGINAEES